MRSHDVCVLRVLEAGLPTGSLAVEAIAIALIPLAKLSASSPAVATIPIRVSLAVQSHLLLRQQVVQMESEVNRPSRADKRCGCPPLPPARPRSPSSAYSSLLLGMRRRSGPLDCSSTGPILACLRRDDAGFLRRERGRFACVPPITVWKALVATNGVRDRASRAKVHGRDLHARGDGQRVRREEAASTGRIHSSCLAFEPLVRLPSWPPPSSGGVRDFRGAERNFPSVGLRPIASPLASHLLHTLLPDWSSPAPKMVFSPSRSRRRPLEASHTSI